MRNDSSYFLDDFDWEAFEAQESSATISKKCQSEEYNLLNRAELHDIVDAEVVSVGENEVVVKAI